MAKKPHDWINEWRHDPSKRLKILRRKNTLTHKYNAFAEKHKWKKTELNGQILANCVYSYYLEVQRHKEFHGIDNADGIKKAAYLTKWLLKTRPIQVLNDNTRSETAKYPLLANEGFALSVALTFLDIKWNAVPNEVITRLLYDFHYRPVVAETLITKFLLLKETYS
ncbi:MAG: hypothetical protein HQL54_03480 [Magnetococcales bacterium]|nr:hypothetical protein [Magnetococcales bacterium]